MSERQVLLAQVVEQANLVAEWQARVDRSLVELREVEGVRGEDLVDDPAALDDLSGRAQDARERASLAQRAQDAAQARLDDARRAVLEFDAIELDAVAAEVSRRVDVHRAKTERLLAQLRTHEGEFVPVGDLIAAQTSPGFLGVIRDGVEPPKSLRLETEAQAARLRPAVLRDVAAGVDPAIRLRDHITQDDTGVRICGLAPADFYPAAVWGAEAVIPCPAYLRQIERLESDLYRVDVEEQKLRERLEGNKTRLAQHTERLEQPRVQGDAGWRIELSEAVESLREDIPRVERELAGIPSRRATARARLRELTTGASDTSTELVAS